MYFLAGKKINIGQIKTFKWGKFDSPKNSVQTKVIINLVKINNSLYNINLDAIFLSTIRVKTMWG